jgi:two-component system, sensor histidine kinase RpfC
MAANESASADTSDVDPRSGPEESDRQAAVLEHERQRALLRPILAAPLWAGAGAVAFYLHDTLAAHFLPALAGFFLAAFALLMASQLARHAAPARQLLGAVLDAGGITYLAAQSGAFGALLFVAHAIVSTDAGRRFGRHALIANAGLGLLGFAVTASVDPYWQLNWQAALGVIAVLIVFPLYLYSALATDTRATRMALAKAALIPTGDVVMMALHRAQENVAALSRRVRLDELERKQLGTINELILSSMGMLDRAGAAIAVERGAPPAADQVFDLFNVLRDAAQNSATTTAADGLPTFRIDPALPSRFRGDAARVRELFSVLLATDVAQRSRAIVYVERVPCQAPDIGIRVDVCHPLDRRARARDTELVLRWLARPLGGNVEIEHRPGAADITTVQIPLRAPQAESEDLNDVEGTRLLLITIDTDCEQRVRAALPSPSVHLVVSPNVATGVDALAQGIRNAQPVHVVLIDALVAFDANGKHVAADLCEKAAAAQATIYLLAQRPLDKAVWRAGGYAGVIATPTATLIARAIRYTPRWQMPLSSTGILHVEPWAWSQRGGGKRRILIVDDNQTNLVIVQSILSAAGYLVDALNSPEQALQRLVSGGYRLAILDLHMPGMDGIRLLRRYHQLRPRGRVPIVFLTANTNKAATRECAEAGADAFLHKPVKRDALLGTIDALLSEHAVHRLASSADARQPEAPTSLLNTDVLRELTRMYPESDGSGGIIGDFRTEAETLLAQMEQAARDGNHQAFTDFVYALRASAANIGAAALAAACHEVGAQGMVEFRRAGNTMLARIREIYDASLAEMHKELELAARG